MTHTPTTHTPTAGEVCADCETSIVEGYAGCGDCLSPDEPWEVTTPHQVWEV